MHCCKLASTHQCSVQRSVLSFQLSAICKTTMGAVSAETRSAADQDTAVDMPVPLDIL